MHTLTKRHLKACSCNCLFLQCRGRQCMWLCVCVFFFWLKRIFLLYFCWHSPVKFWFVLSGHTTKCLGHEAVAATGCGTELVLDMRLSPALAAVVFAAAAECDFNCEILNYENKACSELRELCKKLLTCPKVGHKPFSCQKLSNYRQGHSHFVRDLE